MHERVDDSTNARASQIGDGAFEQSVEQRHGRDASVVDSRFVAVGGV